jgi:hypothetical protein
LPPIYSRTQCNRFAHERPRFPAESSRWGIGDQSVFISEEGETEWVATEMTDKMEYG